MTVTLDPAWPRQAAEHFYAGRFAEARTLYETAAAAEPENILALQGAGNSALRMGAYEAASAWILRAMVLQPNSPELHTNFGALMLETGRFEDAHACYAKALSLDPEYGPAHHNLGFTALQAGDVRSAVTHYRRALASEHDDPVVRAVGHSNLIFLMDFVPEVSGEEALRERLRWDALYAVPLADSLPPPENDPTPDRPLRVGYVGADFFMHSAAFAYGAVLAHHDPYWYEVSIYSGTEVMDAWSVQFRQAANHWIDTRDMDDPTLAARIRADRIDILVDLSGHSKGARTLTFARRPAPVQISAWGHAQGTGIAAMHYLIADPRVVPPTHARFYREQLLLLPSIIPYWPPRYAEPVGPLPATAHGQVTFGSFNRLLKLNPFTFDLWARVLTRVPTSRMVLKGGEFDQVGKAAVMRREFESRGIARDRIVLRGSSGHPDHIANYRDIDLALDPYPHSGGITAMEGLWMGVPPVTLVGDRIPSRLAASFLTTLRYENFIAESADQYVERAVWWATHLDALAEVRAQLRPRMAASILLDYVGYTRLVEQAYRACWRQWCQATASRA